MAISRKHFIAGSAGAFASIGFLRYSADAAEFVYKYANDNPLTHPMGEAAVWWAEQVRRESGGQMEIQVFAGSTLGTDPEMLTQLRAGGIQFLHFSGAILSTLVPVASIDGVAFAFPNYADVWKAVDGELGAYVRGEVRKTGLHIFDRQVDNGFREMTNSVRPINAPGDLKGMKFRVPPSKIQVSMMAGLGASPTSISIAEVYSALQTHVVDGQENPLVIIENNKFYEVQKYCSMTNHMWSGWWLLGNPEAWNKLPKKLQDIVARTYDQSVVRQRANFKKMNDSLQPKLQSQGLTFNRPDNAPFRTALRTAGYYSEWKNTFGSTAWGLLEKAVGQLA